MSIEAFVFGDDEGAAYERWNVGDLDQRASLETQLGDEPTIGRVDLRRLARLVGTQRVGWRTATGATNHGPRGIGEPSAERCEETREQCRDSCRSRVLRAKALNHRGNNHNQPYEFIPLSSIFVPCDLMRCSTSCGGAACSINILRKSPTSSTVGRSPVTSASTQPHRVCTSAACSSRCFSCAFSSMAICRSRSWAAEQA